MTPQPSERSAGKPDRSVDERKATRRDPTAKRRARSSKFLATAIPSGVCMRRRTPLSERLRRRSVARTGEGFIGARAQRAVDWALDEEKLGVGPGWSGSAD